MPLFLEGGNGLQSGPSEVTGSAHLRGNACPRGPSKSLAASFESR